MEKLNFQHLEPAIQLLESSVEYANLVLNNQLLTVLMLMMNSCKRIEWKDKNNKYLLLSLLIYFDPHWINVIYNK